MNTAVLPLNFKLGKGVPEDECYNCQHGYDDLMLELDKQGKLNCKDCGYSIRNHGGSHPHTYACDGFVMPKPKNTVSEHPRTQKSTGIVALSQHNLTVPEFELIRIEKLKTQAQLEKLKGRFCRPCPKTPRHGFVDSRSINSLEEAKALAKETREADEEAEVLSMPFIAASHSAIWCPGQLSIGLGNDGATTGKDCLLVPVLGKPAQDRVKDWKKLLKDAGITEAPYLELLWTKNQPTKTSKLPQNNGKQIPDKAKPATYSIQYVQLRNGPELPDSVDFIPKEMKVEKIVEAVGDLLAWEKKVKTFTPGTVVWHPGGALSSHYSVHCFLHKIPVLTSRKPAAGETLVPNNNTPEPDLTAIRKGFVVGCKMRLDRKQACYLMFAGCHSATKWLGRVDTLLGLSMGATYRLLVTAALGEYRHKSGTVDSSKERKTVYNQRWDHTLRENVLKIYVEAMTSFDKDTNWGQGYGVGGPKWFVLSRYAGLMFNYLLKGDVNKAVQALNDGTNSFHNNNRFFDKFISVSEMDKSSANPVYACLQVAPILYDACHVNITPSSLLKTFDLNNKFTTIDHTLDVKKYLEDRCKAKSYSSSYSAPKIKKLCCDNTDCCGDPECNDCHPPVEPPASISEQLNSQISSALGSGLTGIGNTTGLNLGLTEGLSK